jgi:DNA-binding NtrC family response regulator
MNTQILIVDDEEEFCVSLQKLFTAHRIKCDYCVNANSALARMKDSSYSILISDLRMPEMSGMVLLQKAYDKDPNLSVIMISGYASTDSVVEAMKCGATNFYEKPVPFNKLLNEVNHILEEKKALIPPVGETAIQGVGSIVTANEKMKQLIKIAHKAAKTDAPVIITGRSGTGKELFTSIMHHSSDRKDGPFVKMNCAAIPENLLESELFGYDRGAFTDAKEDRKGKFEIADGGTLFFDEIGDMSLQTQAKLLRVLQEKEFERIGSSKTRKIDVRFVAATNQDLKQKIQSGQFREDLYFRLSVIQIEIPPLEERLDDIMPLTRYYLGEFNKKYHKHVQGVSDDVKGVFMMHSWPGNVRELKNCLERAVIFCEGEVIEVEDLPLHYHPKTESETPLIQSFYDSVNREMILDALDKSQGSRTRAAEILNVSRKTLYLRMKKLGIDV